MNTARKTWRSVALTVIACGAVVAGAASARSQSFSASAGLRGSLPASLGVVMILIERPHDDGCAQVRVPALDVSERGGEAPAALEHRAGFSRLNLGTGGAVGDEGPLSIPSLLGHVLQTASLGPPWTPELPSDGYDLWSAPQASPPAGCQPAALQMTPIIRIAGAAAPEPATWAFLVLGVTMVGSALRARPSAGAGRRAASTA